MLAGVITETMIRMVAELLEYGAEEELAIVERTQAPTRS